MKTFVRVRGAEPLNGFSVRVSFSNGEERVINLEPYVRGDIFESLRRDPALFRQLHVDEELGTIVWPNGADIDPDVLYHGLDPAWRSEPGRVGEEPSRYREE